MTSRRHAGATRLILVALRVGAPSPRSTGGGGGIGDEQPLRPPFLAAAGLCPIRWPYQRTLAVGVSGHSPTGCFCLALLPYFSCSPLTLIVDRRAALGALWGGLLAGMR